LIVAMILSAIIFSPLTFLMSYKLRIEEDMVIDKAAEIVKSSDKVVVEAIVKNRFFRSSAINIRKFLVHDYEERKRNGELTKLRRAFEKTSNRLLKINIGEEDK